MVFDGQDFDKDATEESLSAYQFVTTWHPRTGSSSKVSLPYKKKKKHFKNSS